MDKSFDDFVQDWSLMLDSTTQAILHSSLIPSELSFLRATNPELKASLLDSSSRLVQLSNQVLKSCSLGLGGSFSKDLKSYDSPDEIGEDFERVTDLVDTLLERAVKERKGRGEIRFFISHFTSHLISHFISHFISLSSSLSSSLFSSLFLSPYSILFSSTQLKSILVNYLKVSSLLSSFFLFLFPFYK